MKKLFFLFKFSIYFFLSFYNITIFSFEKKIVIIIPSYNNKDYYIQNLNSVLFQNYSNYRIIYIDDCSPDGTGELVENYLNAQNKNQLVTLIKNKIRRGALANLYNAIHSCGPKEIIVTLDGDDFLKDNNVLYYLNKIYSNENAWLTYGQYENYCPDDQKNHKLIGFARKYPNEIIANSKFRKYGFLSTHLRTFYAWLFQSIKLDDFLYDSKFYKMTWDQVFMFPMLEMSGARHKFINKILYQYNMSNPINDHKVDRKLQAFLQTVIEKKRAYPKLKTPNFIYQNNEFADLIIFIEQDNNKEATEQIELIKQKIIGFKNVFIVSQLNNRFKILHNNKTTMVKNETLLMTSILTKSTTNYLTFINSDTVIKENINLSELIFSLARTKADCFYFPINEENQNGEIILNEQIRTIIKKDFNNVGLIIYPKKKFINYYMKNELKNNLLAIYYNKNPIIKTNRETIKLPFIKSFIKRSPIKQHKNIQKYLIEMNIEWINFNNFLTDIKVNGSTNDKIKNFITSFSKLLYYGYNYRSIHRQMGEEEINDLLLDLGGVEITNARVNNVAIFDSLDNINEILSISEIPKNEFINITIELMHYFINQYDQSINKNELIGQIMSLLKLLNELNKEVE